MNGIELSRGLFEEVLLPMIENSRPEIARQMGCGVFGNGSDAAGLDDEISRDHHWGPRTQILLPHRLFQSTGEEFHRFLDKELPKTYRGLPILRVQQAASGVTVENMDEFFRKFTGYAQAPRTLKGWFKCTEADLFHATNGEVWHDPGGRLTQRREGFGYFPEIIWKKKVADWCMFLTGRDAAYNVNRCYRREDWASATMFLGQAVKRAMELGFLLNRQYAPYTKWLHRLFVRLPVLAKQVDPLLQEALHNPNWHKKVMALVRICRIYARYLHKIGLTPKPTFKKFDPSLTDLVLYESAVEIYKQVPDELRDEKFNETELWERLARDAIFDASDFFQKGLE
ncbi:MAG: DUF4037 domain-containing protein [Planctomycetota bacterium]|jgi:hypothetical protein|nr:DUF4037 domain-containing protein [Planctomycetota bacterium]MDP7248602.1 DUF4037 domain-containing protein [Planctomycetota bacterium]